MVMCVACAMFIIGNEMEGSKKEFWQNIFHKAALGEKISIESKYLTSSDKKHVVIKISALPVYNSLGIVDYIIAVYTFRPLLLIFLPITSGSPPLVK